MPESSKLLVLWLFSLQLLSTQSQSISLINPSFEADPHQHNYYYRSAGPTGWSVEEGGDEGTTGQRGTVVATNGNGPWGSLSSGMGAFYIVLQRRGFFIEQPLSGLTIGETYSVRFLASSRGAKNEMLKVEVAGTPILVLNLRRGFAQYDAYFSAQASTEILRFENNCADDNDRSVFVDDISVQVSSPPPPPPPPPYCLQNPSFEADGHTQDYYYMANGPTGWDVLSGGSEGPSGSRGTVVARNGNTQWGGLSSGVGSYFAVMQREGFYLKQNLCNLTKG